MAFMLKAFVANAELKMHFAELKAMHRNRQPALTRKDRQDW